MNKLDPHTLFSLFEQGDEEVYKEHGVEDTLKNPYVLLNMVSKGMDNYAIMDMLYKKNYPDTYKNVRKDVQYKYYVRLFRYLERIDVKSIEDNTYTIGESYDLPNLIIRLDDLRAFFERCERYERCGVIKDTIDLLYEQSIKQITLDKLFI
tara:strand:- start:15618 stop:16070 length:453 start_codon:yes stop_codon:yes gene_type:complete